MALGSLSLSSNTSGNNNTTVGSSALENSVATSRHVMIGSRGWIWDHASSITTLSSATILVCTVALVRKITSAISATSMVRTLTTSARLPVWCSSIRMEDWAQCALGHTPTPAPTPSGRNPGKSSPEAIRPQAIPDGARQTTLNIEVQNLEATISQQQNQIEILTARIQEQIAQIQKVNARLEMNKPAAKIIANKPKAVP